MYGDSGADAAAQARRQEQEREGRVQEGVSQIDASFGGFNDAFYDARKQAYLDTAMPQYYDQYQTTRNSLAEGLARRGLLNSGAAVRANDSLQRYAKVQSNQIADQAQGAENALREDVANERQDLVNQVVASGDPTAASNATLAAATAARRGSTFAPIGNLFSDWTNVWRANQAANYYNVNPVPYQAPTSLIS
jgi:hypothetical protein